MQMQFFKSYLFSSFIALYLLIAGMTTGVLKQKEE